MTGPNGATPPATPPAAVAQAVPMPAAATPPVNPTPATPLSGDPAAADPPAAPTGDPAAPAPATADAESQTLGSGGAASEATSRSGNGTSRERSRRHAEQRIIGDFVHGDKYVLQMDGERVPLRLLSPDLLDEVRGAWAAPDGWDDWCERLRPQRVVILRGQPGQGRDTIATRLLTWHAVEEIFALDRRVDLGRLAERIAEPGHASGRPTGYLLPAPESVAGLNRLDDALLRVDGWIVMTVGADTRLAENENLRYVVEMPAMPGPAEILAQHMRYRFGDFDGPQVLATADVKELVESILPLARSCEEVAWLAWLLHQETRDGTTDVAQVRKRRARHSTDRFGIWFGGLGDLDTRCLAITLAVLDGHPVDDVLRAARSLRKRMPGSGRVGVADDGTLHQQRSDPLLETTAGRLDRLQAERYEGTVIRTEAVVPTTRIRFREKSLGSRLIEHIWSDYQIQPTLLDWLRELMVDVAEEIRIFASTTVGLLAARSFEYLDRNLFQPWATGGTPVQREAVAMALGVAAAHERRLRTVVAATIGGWYVSGNPLAQATAARSYGSSIGRTDHTAAVEALARLAAIDNIHIAIAIGDSLTDLLLDDPSRGPYVLRTLLSWTSDRRRTATAEFCFLIIAIGLVTVPREGDGGTEGSRPTLLDLANTQPDLRDPLCELWISTLNGASWSSEAAGVLTQWAAQVEHNPVLLEMFGRLMRALVQRSSRTRASLARLRGDWIDDDNLRPLPHAAAILSSVLG